MVTKEDLRVALIQADPQLSKFNPLPRILFYDDFDKGINGWCELCGNYDRSLDDVSLPLRDLRPPQLSNCTFFDIGTHGSMEGTYALKLATRPKPNHTSFVLKRLTFVHRGLVQFETYFTYTAEPTFGKQILGPKSWDGNYHPSEAHFGDFTISNDVCEGEDGQRYHCALRYVNTDHKGNFVKKWMYKTSVFPTTRMRLMEIGSTRTDLHTLTPEDWAEVPGGDQSFCYNEVPTKVNWHYLRWLFDTRKRRNVELQVNDKIMDLRDVDVPQYDHSYGSLDNLLNFGIDVRTHLPVRNFLYLDAVLVSVDW